MQWISVKDKLPEHNMCVIICYKKGRFLIIGEAAYIHEEKCFEHPYYGQDILSKINNVTHWMPLPEPPEK